MALTEAALALDPAVAETMREVRQSGDVAPYAALRRLWRRWDQTDSVQIEEALVAVEQDAAVTAPVRVYAGLLGAYARRRRGDLAGARRKVRDLGYVSSWLVVGPFDNETKASLFTPFGPEDNLGGALPAVGHHYEGKERPVSWRALPAASPYGWLDLGTFVRPSEKICAYATTFVRQTAKESGSAGETGQPGTKGKPKGATATIWVGASGAWRAFWNGQEILADDGYRALDPDRLSARVTVKESWNRLTFKVCGDEEGPMLQVRLADGKGAPDPSFETSNDRELGAKSEHHVTSSRKGLVGKDAEGIRIVERGTIDLPAKRKLPTPTGGPLASLPGVMNNKGTKVETVEALARYLAVTGGDDRKEHFTRDLAQRAVELRPTLARRLLVAELASDQNEKGSWLRQARERMRADENDTELLLAEAVHARAGANPREAMPALEKVLAREPNNVAAMVERAELYEEAGLRQTALAEIESAAGRLPHAVALWRVLAHLRRATGRTAEAEEAERRYASLRFDDPTFLRGRLELAAVRRDQAATTHWAERLLSVEPDAFPATEAVVRAFRAVGDTPRALSLLRQRLDLIPDDVDAIRLLADVHGEDGRHVEQVNLLRRLLVLQPQAKDVREYVEQAGPGRARPDESYAWDRERILKAAQTNKPTGFSKRTLRDLHVTTVYSNGLSSRFFQLVFQPLTEEGAAAARQYVFSFQSGREVVDLRAARVFRANGKTDESVETGEAPADSPGIATYSSARSFYVQLPRLGPGDVVELRYRIDDITPRNEFGDSFSETTYLQSFEPILSSEYVLVTPPKKKVNVRLHGHLAVQREESSGHVVRVTATNVAPLAPEPNMLPWPEVAANVTASTFDHWDDVGRWFWGLARDQFDVDDDVRRLTKEIVKGRVSTADRVRAVYDYIVQRTRYVALEFGIEGFRPRRASQTLARGWGDCKDKATAIVTMLRELGIPANVVLVRTGMRGDAPTDAPSYAFFDHAIAYVPELNLYLDGTAEYTGSTELPVMDRGALALQILPEGKTKLVRLPEPNAEATLRAQKADITLRENGAAEVVLRVEATGALAAQARQRYHATATQRTRIQEDFGREFGGLLLSEEAAGVSTNDLEDVERPVSLQARGTGLGLTKKSDGMFTISLATTSSLVARYASLSQRHYPLKIPFAAIYEDEWTIHLPPGYVVKGRPADRSLLSPFGRFDFTLEARAGQLTFHTRLRLDQTRIEPSAYGAFRTFCADVDQTLTEPLRLGKPLGQKQWSDLLLKPLISKASGSRSI